MYKHCFTNKTSLLQRLIRNPLMNLKNDAIECKTQRFKPFKKEKWITQPTFWNTIKKTRKITKTTTTTNQKGWCKHSWKNNQFWKIFPCKTTWPHGFCWNFVTWNHDHTKHEPFSLNNESLKFLSFWNCFYSAIYNKKHQKFWLAVIFMR